MPDDNAHAADDTRTLRARFPRWGILFDPLESVWIAVRGKRTLVAASSPEKLTEQVEAASRGEAGPDEGDKTQTWRALRKYERGLAAGGSAGTRGDPRAEVRPGPGPGVQTAAARRRTAAVQAGTCYFFPFFLLFLLFLATRLTPLPDPAGQRYVDKASTYH
jgi:hypothetical protein